MNGVMCKMGVETPNQNGIGAAEEKKGELVRVRQGHRKQKWKRPGPVDRLMGESSLR